MRMHRRSLLTASTLAGLMPWLGRSSLANPLAAEEMPLPVKPAKACIFLFMWGGPSQLETFDMKPNAPAEVRGDFRRFRRGSLAFRSASIFRNWLTSQIDCASFDR